MQGAIPSKVVIQWLEPSKKSSDIAEEMVEASNKKKEKSIQSLNINLASDQNSNIKTIIEKFANGQIDKNVAFAEIKTQSPLGDKAEHFNDAYVQYKIDGRKTRTVRFGEIENQIGAYDITDSFDITDPETSLVTCADKYYNKIVEEIM